MQRLPISFLSIVAFAASARAQPAPDAAAPPAHQPPSPPGDPRAERAAPPPPAPPPTADAGPRKLAVGKESPGASFTPGLLMQGWFVLDENTKTSPTGDTNVSTTTFRIRRLEISAGGD